MTFVFVAYAVGCARKTHAQQAVEGTRDRDHALIRSWEPRQSARAIEGLANRFLGPSPPGRPVSDVLSEGLSEQASPYIFWRRATTNDARRLMAHDDFTTHNDDYSAEVVH